MAAAVSLGPVPRPPAALAEPEIYASPVQAGCYLARADRCKIHVDPFTINLAAGKKLVRFSLVATRVSTGAQTTIYDIRTDQSNPAPSIGSTYSPSLVKKDFAAACGQAYTVSLQGQDTGDANPLNLGLTAQFTCPKGTYTLFLPVMHR
jgi:hypothetical protein